MYKEFYTWFMNPFSWISRASLLPVVMSRRVSKFYHHQISVSGYNNVRVREVCLEGRSLSLDLVLRHNSWAIDMSWLSFHASPMWEKGPPALFCFLFFSYYPIFQKWLAEENAELQNSSWVPFQVLHLDAGVDPSSKHPGLEESRDSEKLCVCHRP